MLNAILDFIANHPYLVFFSVLFTLAITAICGAHVRRYENAYEIPHVFSNAIILVIIVYGGLLSYGVSQTHVETVKAPAYKDLDMTQTFVFNPQEKKKDDTDGLLVKGYHAVFGKDEKKPDPTVDTSKTITTDMVDYLQGLEHLNTTMVVSKDGQKTEQTVVIDKVIVKGSLQKGNTAKITKIAFKKPTTYRYVVFEHKATRVDEPTEDGAVTITVEAVDNTLNKQFD